MPKAHNIGTERFVQVIKQPLTWGNKLIVHGWTQEIEEPFRFAAPIMVRLPLSRILVLGKWQGTKSEEEALNSAISRRDLTYDDFEEEKGWRPPPDKDTEAYL
jgi:hypothetical protein